MTPTQRSIAHMKARGYTVAIVERWNQFARIRQDLFGFGDLLCIQAAYPPMIVQVTASGVSARLKKIAAEPRHVIWLNACGVIEVHGWTKKGAKGKRKTYQIRIVPVTLEERA